VGAEQLVERLAVALGKTLHPEQRTLVAQNGQDRHQQHPPLRVANPTAHAAIGQRLEEADQIRCSGWVLERQGQRDSRRDTAHQTGADCRGSRQGYWDRLLMGPVMEPDRTGTTTAPFPSAAGAVGSKPTPNGTTARLKKARAACGGGSRNEVTTEPPLHQIRLPDILIGGVWGVGGDVAHRVSHRSLDAWAVSGGSHPCQDPSSAAI
jgi:hypothetical protein